MDLNVRHETPRAHALDTRPAVAAGLAQPTDGTAPALSGPNAAHSVGARSLPGSTDACSQARASNQPLTRTDLPRPRRRGRPSADTRLDLTGPRGTGLEAALAGLGSPGVTAQAQTGEIPKASVAHQATGLMPALAFQDQGPSLLNSDKLLRLVACPLPMESKTAQQVKKEFRNVLEQASTAQSLALSLYAKHGVGTHEIRDPPGRCFIERNSSGELTVKIRPYRDKEVVQDLTITMDEKNPHEIRLDIDEHRQGKASQRTTICKGHDRISIQNEQNSRSYFVSPEGALEMDSTDRPHAVKVGMDGIARFYEAGTEVFGPREQPEENPDYFDRLKAERSKPRLEAVPSSMRVRDLGNAIDFFCFAATNMDPADVAARLEMLRRSRNLSAVERDFLKLLGYGTKEEQKAMMDLMREYNPGALQWLRAVLAKKNIEAAINLGDPIRR